MTQRTRLVIPVSKRDHRQGPDTAAVTLGGNAWDKAGPIWYEALRSSQLRANATFRSFAAATVRQAGLLYGADEEKAVREAWLSVGVRP